MDTKKRNNDSSLRTFEKLGHALGWQDLPGGHPDNGTPQFEGNTPILSSYDNVVADKSNLLPERNWNSLDVSGLLLDFTKPYTPPKWTLSHNGVPFAKLADLHFVSGKPGGGKTSLMAQIVVTLLKGSFYGLKRELKTDNPFHILFVDTEQSEDDSIATKNRICTMAGIDYNVKSEVFFFARLRETVKAEDRYRQILKLIYKIRPTVLFIDGMLDLVEDYNKQEECTPLIRELMLIATEYNMSIWCVLHENLTTDKMVGVLGSIAQRKSTEVFVTRVHNKDLNKDDAKNYPNFPDIFYSVEAIKTRGKYVKKWYFEILDEHGWGMPREIMAQEILLDDNAINAIRNLLGPSRHVVWKTFRKELADYLEVDVKIANGILNEARKYGIIIDGNCGDRHTWSFNPEFGEDNALPFK